VRPAGLDGLAARWVMAPGGALVLVGDAQVIREALGAIADRVGPPRVISVEDALEGRLR